MDLIPMNYPQSASSRLPLQSYLFGHRVQPSQTKYEYLIEFLQVAISPKELLRLKMKLPNQMFPVAYDVLNDIITYYPATRIGLKRFIFLPKSKLDGKAEVDKAAYNQCVEELIKNISGGNSIKRRNCVSIMQNLMRGFSAVNQSRSWFDQNVLPICPEVILPEGMGVKRWRQGVSFSSGNAEVDHRFDYHKYTYMCRGGEVYYLHLLSAINQFPEKRELLESRIQEMINSFPQFSYICNFIQNTWEKYMLVTEADIEAVNGKVKKDLGAIPASFNRRNEQLLGELENFFNSKAHPFEKMEMFSNGIILQLLRVMYLAASTETESNCWVVDVNSKGMTNPEVKKLAVSSFRHNEEVISNYLYKGLEEFRGLLQEEDEEKIIKDASNDSFKLFRKMGKMIGVVIPMSGPGMRFSLSEEIISFLVLSIIPPKHMITLDEFIDRLYEHFGMVIGPKHYELEAQKGSVKAIGDISFLEDNKRALAQKLKDCGFLRDLSDATAIVENPYESEA